MTNYTLCEFRFFPYLCYQPTPTHKIKLIYQIGILSFISNRSPTQPSLSKNKNKEFFAHITGSPKWNKLQKWLS